MCFRGANHVRIEPLMLPLKRKKGKKEKEMERNGKRRERNEGREGSE